MCPSQALTQVVVRADGSAPLPLAWVIHKECWLSSPGAPHTPTKRTKVLLDHLHSQGCLSTGGSASPLLWYPRIGTGRPVGSPQELALPEYLPQLFLNYEVHHDEIRQKEAEGHDGGANGAAGAGRRKGEQSGRGQHGGARLPGRGAQFPGCPCPGQEADFSFPFRGSNKLFCD